MANTITRFGKPEPQDRCAKWKIQTAINVKLCKRYARGDSKHQNSQTRMAEMGKKTWKLVF